MPAFSVIIPAFNRAALIEATLDSVMSQTCQDWEVIVVDDGSTDGTSDVVQQYADRRGLDEARLKLVRQPNAGVCAARNAGVRHANGRYVQFLDSDDFIHPERLATLLSRMETDQADFAVTGFDGFVGDRTAIIERRPARTDMPLCDQALIGKFWGNSLRCAYRRDLLDRIGPWDESFICFEDREFTERALFAAKRPIAIADILATARRSGDNRLSRFLRTKQGRGFRIECERRLLESAQATRQGSQAALSEYASRLYGLGMRSFAEGWIRHGLACGALARQSGGVLDARGRRRRLAWRLGPVGGRAYLALGALKDRMSGGVA